MNLLLVNCCRKDCICGKCDNNTIDSTTDTGSMLIIVQLLSAFN